ncbi:MAG: PIN domain-containing protein [Candidatus Micrarchaeota archaeon]
MELIVDANIVFAALVKEGLTIELLLEPELHLSAPEFLFEEIEKHKEEIFKKTHRTKEEVEELLEILKIKIDIIPKESFEVFLEHSEKISPDPNDCAYFALALKLRIPIWTNERDLKEKQSTVKVYNTKDLFEMLI